MAARKAPAVPPEGPAGIVPVDAPAIQIRRVGTKLAIIPLVGTAPLIMNRFSEKAKRQMLEAQQGGKKIKQVRDPEADYKGSIYHTDDGGFGFPALAFKDATCGAARYFGREVTMVSLRQSLFFQGDYSKAAGQTLTRIEGEPRMREDVVTVGIATRDLRFRAEFPEWRATLSILFVDSMLSIDSVLALIEAGGMGVGVGEWRPERSGEFGTYRIDDTRKMEVVG